MRVVTRQVLAAGLDAPIVVASDDARVLAAVEPLRSRGVEPVPTGAAHASGTERVAEVIRMLRYRGAAIVLNVQGDEPFVTAEMLRGAIARVAGGDPIGTAAAPLTSDALGDPHQVKVVVDGDGRALRFSRTYPGSAGWGCDVTVLRHLGVYAYTRDALLRWVSLPPVGREREEGLEQLRPLAYGIPIGVARVAAPAAPGIDTEADLQRAEAVLG